MAVSDKKATRLGVRGATRDCAVRCVTAGSTVFFDVTLDRIADPTVPDGCPVAQSTLSSPSLEHAHSDENLLDELATYVVAVTQSLAELSRGGMSTEQLHSTVRLARESVARQLG